MNYHEYIEVKNLINIYEFYGESYLKPENGDHMWASRTRLLLNAMCELEKDNKYPASSGLHDIIDFVNNNQDAEKLKNYLNILPGFQPSLGINQGNDTYNQHGFVSMGLENLKQRNLNNVNEVCTFNLNGQFRLREDVTGMYLNIERDNFSIHLEKRNEFQEKTFRYNNIIVNDIEFSELINMIAYGDTVKIFSKENTQAAYFFLN